MIAEKKGETVFPMLLNSGSIYNNNNTTSNLSYPSLSMLLSW